VTEQAKTEEQLQAESLEQQKQSAAIQNPQPPNMYTQSETTDASMLGAIAGQGRLDRLADDTLQAAARVLTPDRLKLLAIVSKAKDADELRRLVAEAYQGMDETRLADVLMRAWAEAELVGLWSQR
jgi:hypothetical protein